MRTVTSHKLSGKPAFDAVMRGEWRTLVRELGWRHAISWKWETSLLNYIVTVRPPLRCIIGRHDWHHETITEDHGDGLVEYLKIVTCHRSRCELWRWAE